MSVAGRGRARVARVGACIGACTGALRAALWATLWATLVASAGLVPAQTARAQEPTRALPGAPDPILVRGRSADVLVHSPAARDSTADALRLAHLIAGCRLAMEILPADSADAVSLPSPPFPLDVWQVRDAIVISVLPVAERLVDCDDPRTQAALAPTRGLRVTLDTGHVLERDVDAVTVRRGDRAIRPLVVERFAVRRLGAGGFRAPRDHWMRLAFDRAAFDPGASGVIDDLTLEVRSPLGDVTERIAVPWVAVRLAWESSLAARPELGARYVPPVALDAPADAGLATVHAAYAAGEPERVVRLAVSHLRGGTVRLRRDARLRASLALLSLGDTASARVVAATMLVESPCVSLDTSAAAGAHAAFAALRRPPARCAAQSPSRTLLRALFMPGFARPGTGVRLDTRLLIAAASVGTTFAAVRLHEVAGDRYDRYLAYQARPVAPEAINSEIHRLHAEAEQARHASVSAGAIGTLLWVGQGVWALRRERAFAAQLRTERNVGRARTVRLTPDAGPSGVGLTLSLSW